MKHTMQYSVGGQLVDVAPDRKDEFFADVANNGQTADEIVNYRVAKADGTTQDVPVSTRNIEAFAADVERNGDTAYRIRNFVMDDGTPLSLRDNDIQQMVAIRKQGLPISRSVLKNMGIPDIYGKSRAEREAIADQLVAMFPEESRYGLRNDGKTYKGSGWLGELKTADGGVATEYTVQSDAVRDKDGNRIDFPLLVPTLTEDEVSLMVNDIIPNHKQVPDEIMQKAVDHARMRLAKGESVFANDGAEPYNPQSGKGENLGDMLTPKDTSFWGAIKEGAKGAWDVVSSVANPALKLAGNAISGAGNLSANGVVMPNGIAVGGTGRLGGDSSNPDEIALKRRNNIGNKIGSAVNGAIDIVFPTAKNDNEVTATIQSVGEEVGGIVKFATSKTAPLMLANYGEKWNADFDEYIKAGHTPSEAAAYADAGGVTGATLDGVLKVVPVSHFIKKGFGYKEASKPIKMLIDSIGELGEKDVKGIVGKSIAKDVLANMSFEAATMGGIGAVQSFVDSCIRQKGITGEIDAKLALADAWEAAKSGAITGTAMGAVTSVPRAVETAKLKQPLETAKKEFDTEVRKLKAEEARKRYETTLSDEALDDIDTTVAKMVEREVIPSWSHAEEVKANAIKKLGGREKGESHEAVEQAVMEAAQEVQERLGKTERVETAALERRQAEYEMRLNEARAKREAEKKRGVPKEKMTPLPEKPSEVEAVKPVENAPTSASTETQPTSQEKAEMSVETPSRVSDGKGKMVEAEKPSEEYPTITDKTTGKKRLTGIAAQRKAASDAEKAARKKFAEEELNGAGEFSSWVDKGRLFSEPPYRTVKNSNGKGTHKEYYGDPAAEAINHALDGLRGQQREKMEDLLFGKKGNRVKSSITGNDAVYQNNDYDRVISDFTKSYEKYEEFKKNGSKTSQELKAEYEDAEARAREVKIGGEYYDIEDIEVNNKFDKVYNNAVVEVYAVKDGSPFIKHFSYDELKNLKKGDTIRFDHSEADFEVESYNHKNNEIVVSMDGVKDNPFFTDAERTEMSGRRFRLTENGWIELNGRNTENGNERKNAKGTDKTLPRNAEGKQASNLELESATAEELAAEQKRLADRLDLHRLDPKLRSDPKIIAWAKKKGRAIDGGKVSPDAVREYEAQQAQKAAKSVKRWFPDMKVVYHDYGEKIKRGQHVIEQKIEPGDDAAYLDAVKRGDMETAQRMVREAAIRNGYDEKPRSIAVRGDDAFVGQIQYLIPSMPTELARLIASWDVKSKSPYSNSFYNSNGITWDYKPDRSLRVADHWNFVSRGEVHCVTDTPVEDGKWTLAKYHAEDRKYHVIRQYDKVETNKSVKQRDQAVKEYINRAIKKLVGRKVKGFGFKNGTLESVEAGAEGYPVGVVKVSPSGKTIRENGANIVSATDVKWDKFGSTLRKGATDYSVFFNPSLGYIKSADPVTYDNAGNVIPLSQRFNADSSDIRYLRDTAGRSFGWFDPKSKEVHLLPGSNAETVAHEIMWHGVRDWATTEAGKGNAQVKALLAKMKEIEQNIPESLKDKVTRLYRMTGVTSADVLFDEWGAWFTMGKGGKEIEKVLDSAEGRRWFARSMNTVKEIYKDFLTAHGKNRVDLKEIDGMGRDEFVDWLAKNFASGKTLGNIKGEGTGKELSTTETKFQAARRKVYDVNSALTDLQADIEKKTGKKIGEDMDAAGENTLASGLRDAEHLRLKKSITEYKGIIASSDGKVSDQDIQYYMELKAAAGRDAKVDARNKQKLAAEAAERVRREWGTERIKEDNEGFKAAVEEAVDAVKAEYESTNGSHVDPREAKKMLAELENGEHKEIYAKARQKLREMMDETLRVQEEAGLISHEEAERLRKEEPEYVPFKNEYDLETGEWIGRGLNNFNKPEFYQAKGRQSSAGDITTHIFMDNQAAHQRAIENNVREKLAKLVEANPELGKVRKLNRNAEFGDSVAKLKEADNIVLFKRNGESYVIELNGTRGKAIANAITEKRVWRPKNAVWNAFAKFSRTQAGLATRYSLTFPGRNVVKDNIELANIVFSERGLVNGTKWMSHYAKSSAQMAKTIGKYVITGEIDVNTAEGKLLKRYIDAGGLISGGATEGYGAIKQLLTPEAIEKEMKRGKSKSHTIAKHTLKSIAYMNEFFELTTRVNAFAAETAMGATDRDAAIFARRVTVDFNRHGEWTGVTNVVRMFSNSTLGATARAATALGKSKYGKAVAGAYFVYGLAQSLIEYYMNREEDEKAAKTGRASGKDVSEYERRTSLFHIRRGDKFYKVAQHESPFSLFSYAGDLCGRLVTGQITVKDAAKNLGVSVAELGYAFTGLGNINLQSQDGGLANDAKAAFVSGVVPSVLQPVVEITLNMDYKGAKPFRKNYSEPVPDSSVAKSHTPEWAKSTAEYLNKATRDDESLKGYIDIPPEAVQKLVEGYGKNAFKDVMDVYETGKAIITGKLPELDVRNIPVVRDVVRPLDGNTARFYKAMDRYENNKLKFDHNDEPWKEGERAAYLKSHPWLRKNEGRRLIDTLNNKTEKEYPRVPTADMGINQLRKLTEGKIRHKDGTYFEPNTPISEEVKERARQRLLKLQARVVEIMGE